MQLRKKILSHFLLATYFLVVLHQSVSHNHSSEIANSKTSQTTHQHEDFKVVHHEHHFHVGIFHFLGHLFENTSHQNDLEDEHLVFFQKTVAKKVFDYNKSFHFYATLDNLIVFSVDAESLPDPPYHVSLLQRFKQPNTPLRAPPALV